MSHEPFPLIEALPARLDDAAVMIIDIGERSVLVEHSFHQLSSPPSRRLFFQWEGEEIDVSCTVRESVMQDLLSDHRQKVTYHARLEYDSGADLTALQRAREKYRQRLDAAQEANLSGEPSAEAPSATMARIGDALREHKLGYLACLHREGRWVMRETKSPLQPIDGFTVAAFEDPHQIRVLQIAYEEADLDGRELIRKFAAASLDPR